MNDNKYVIIYKASNKDNNITKSFDGYYLSKNGGLSSIIDDALILPNNCAFTLVEKWNNDSSDFSGLGKYIMKKWILAYYEK